MLPTLPMSSNGDSSISQEKNWSHAATLYLLELIKDRKSQLLGNSIANGKKIEVWRSVADLMRQKGFLQTENTVMKKFYNMRRTYAVILKEKTMIASERTNNKEWQKHTGNKGKRWLYYNLMSELMDENDQSSISKPDSSSEETFRNLIGTGTEILLQDVDGLAHSHQNHHNTDTTRETLETYAAHSHNRLVETTTNKAEQTIVIKTPRSRTIQFHSVSPEDNSFANNGDNLSSLSEIDRNGFVNTQPPQQNNNNTMPANVVHPQENHAIIVGTSANSSPLNVELSHMNPSANNNFQQLNNNVTTTTHVPSPKSRTNTYRRPNSRPSIAITNKRSRLNEELLVEEVQGMRQEVRGINRNLEKLVDVHNRLNDNLERFLTAIRIRID